MPPPALWASWSVCVAVLQLGIAYLLVPQTGAGSGARAAIVGVVVMTGLLALPLGALAARISRRLHCVYWCAGRVWAMAVTAAFAKTISGAHDGSGPLLAERVTTPCLFPAVVGLSVCIGVQGALLGVPRDVAVNVLSGLVAMTVIKLQVAFTPAYALLNGACLGGIVLGYVGASKYADLREAEREAAEAVVLGAIAVNQPYLVTDASLRILAVNQRFVDVLGYERDEVYGKPVSSILEASVDTAWVQAVLSKEQTDHVWSVVTRAGPTRPVRITLGATRNNGATLFWAKLASMELEHRNAQLHAEKERLQWDLATTQGDARELLAARVAEGTEHRTLGAMQDQQKTDDAVSNAHSFDHAGSTGSPIPPTRPHPPTATSNPGSVATFCTLASSEQMDSVSEAARKSPTRAPAPPRRRGNVRFARRAPGSAAASEPAAPPPSLRHPAPPPRNAPLPVVERVQDLFESC